jgi:hypothetical protein
MDVHPFWLNSRDVDHLRTMPYVSIPFVVNRLRAIDLFIILSLVTAAYPNVQFRFRLVHRSTWTTLTLAHINVSFFNTMRTAHLQNRATLTTCCVIYSCIVSVIEALLQST